jgi:hypothetical protein
MKRKIGLGLGMAALMALAGSAFAAEVEVYAKDQYATKGPLPMVPAAAPGVFTMQKKGANVLHLVVTGHKFTSREDAEKYLAWRAAELTMAQKANWFTFTEARAKGDAVPAPQRDAAGKRYSFRMEYWRPMWRYKLAGDAAWKRWSPFQTAAFFADGKDPKSVSDFEVSADITLRTGPMDDANPLAFEAGAVSDLLINQVSPPV